MKKIKLCVQKHKKVIISQIHGGGICPPPAPPNNVHDSTVHNPLSIVQSPQSTAIHLVGIQKNDTVVYVGVTLNMFRVIPFTNHIEGLCRRRPLTTVGH